MNHLLFWQIAKKDLLTTYRDKSAWFILILMPIVLILIFTAVFGSNNENLALFPIDVAIVNLDEGGDMWGGAKVSDDMITFFKSEEIQPLLNTTTVSTEAEAQQLIQDGKVAAAIIIPASYSNAYFISGTKAETRVLGDAASSIGPGVVKAIVDSFITVMEANRIQMDSTLRIVGQIDLKSFVKQQIISEMMNQPAIRQLPLEFEEVAQEGKDQLSMSGYYSAAMAVMFLLFAGNMGIFSIIEERENRTILRLRTSALNKSSLVLGKFFMVVILGICQLAILMLFTSVVTKVNWGSSWTGLAVLSLAGVSSVAALSIFVAAITKSSQAANALNWVAIQILAFFGGSFIPIDQMPGLVQFINKLTVNGQALRGYMTLMQGGGLMDVLNISLLLFGVTVVLLALGSYFLQYSEEGI